MGVIGTEAGELFLDTGGVVGVDRPKVRGALMKWARECSGVEESSFDEPCPFAICVEFDRYMEANLDGWMELRSVYLFRERMEAIIRSLYDGNDEFQELVDEVWADE